MPRKSSPPSYRVSSLPFSRWRKGASLLAVLMGCLIVAGERAGVHAQAPVLVNTAPLEGIELRPDNVYGFQIINNSGALQRAIIKGTIKYRASPLQASYTFSTTLQPGVNVFNRQRVGSPAWTFSTPALRELFFSYAKLPQGTYEYCVELTLGAGPGGEPGQGTEAVSGCTYNTVEDIFLIQLVEPEDKAEIYEHYPMFSWVVNYPFASELTYRIRVAEIKAGQNTQNAVVRNNPVYTESNLLSTTATYPVTARPLKTWQPYAWTVDAYYKGILLGGAEAWRFTIIEDSLLASIPREQSYYEFDRHVGDTRLYAVGVLKLKYISEQHKDTLFLQLKDAQGDAVGLKSSTLSLQPGDNRIDLEFSETPALIHRKMYELHLRTKNGKSFIVPFKYINPLYLD